MEVKLDNFMALKTFTKVESTFVIGERTFRMKPLVPRKLKELVVIVESSGKEISNILKEFNASIGYVLSRMADVFPVIFSETVSQDFIDNNMSIPVCLEIWDQFIKLNRLEKALPFFLKAVKVTAIKELQKNQTN